MNYRCKIRRRVLVSLAMLWVLPLFVSAVSAQSGGGIDQTGTGGRHIIQGRIYYPSGRRSDSRLKIKLKNFNSGELSVFSDPNGSFSFKGLDPGSYTVIVEAGDAYETASQTVYIDTDGTNTRRGVPLPPVSRIYTVDISLQLKPAEMAKIGVVNAVLAAVPTGARALYLKGVESAQADDNAKAIEQLKAAIAIYPQFPLALNALGVSYLRVGEIDKAAEAFKSAVDLSPEDFQPRLNYGIALLNQRRFADAEEQLRTTLVKNNDAPTAHMYLGIVLAIERKLDEGEKELRLALASNSPEVFLSHRYLAGIYLERHENARAAEELESYLKQVPKASDADMLRRKIKELKTAK